MRSQMAFVIITADDVLVAIMTPATARIFMRVVGTFSGLVAFPCLCVGPFMLYSGIRQRRPTDDWFDHFSISPGALLPLRRLHRLVQVLAIGSSARLAEWLASTR